LSLLAGLQDFAMFRRRAAGNIDQRRLSGVVDVAIAALTIDVHPLLQLRIGSREQHPVKRAVVHDPFVKILPLFIQAQIVENCRQLFDVRIAHVCNGDCR
jgi:hypothetical protein